MDPVTKAMILKTKPDGAKLFVIKERFLFLKTKIPNDKTAINEKNIDNIKMALSLTYLPYMKIRVKF